MQKTTQESITSYMLTLEINEELTYSQHDRIDVMCLHVHNGKPKGNLT
jgi:hypothetical protein